ncbi:putative carboxylesterase [Pleomassaria siparia CBS 279.74]|uniref:Putative carboxylesterase n=1 Tax=Pleomassaria siparia CBS 279.74 TaxID=1314801 RepID=A0A6G1JU72_9PLEO|nr:putative carboxylesterase [Pleomassaria siparia CBS 279.74]
MGRFKSVLISAVLAVNAFISPTQAQLFDKVIQTQYGPVQGFSYFDTTTLQTYFNVSTSNVAAFLGIPFAADTGYQNRWKAPQPRESWNDTLLANDFGPSCPSSLGTQNYSEDCLSLNIWTNAVTANASLPVLVWNQGSEEASNNTWWYGGGMALKDVIVVTFNRRDDVFGYLAHPELNAEGLASVGYNTSGNYGILDHLEVLKWVQKNIANFGGDATKVTVAGQSFGSAQAYHAVNSPLFTGYFRAAISESGIRYPYDTLVAGLATSYVNMSAAISYGINYTQSHNVSTVAELRTLSTDEIRVGSSDRVGNESMWWITALSTDFPLKFKPVLDGYVIPQKYIDELLSGPANDVPLITGNTRDESGAELRTNYTLAQYESYCSLKYGNLSSQYFELYPAGNSSTTATDSWRLAARDTSLVSSWAFGTEWVKSASSPFWTYYWDHAPPGQNQGAFHQSEIMYVMNALYANNYQYPFTSYDYYVAEVMSTYWANFIKTLDPNVGTTNNGSNLTHWSPNDGTSQTVMELGEAFAPTKIAEPEQVSLILDYFAQQSPY